MKNIFKRIKKVLFTRPKIYIISYPKTGRTWVRTLIGKSLSDIYNLPEEKLLETRYITNKAGLPITGFTHEDSAMKFEQAYYELEPSKKYFRNKKIILIGRNVKDTLVSAYFQAVKRINVYDGTISEFIRNDYFGALKFITFYKIWFNNKDIPEDLLFITYEDLHKDTHQVLQSILTFIGVENIDKDIIDEAVKYSSFDNLRKAEKSNKFNSSILSPSDINDEESYKVRKGKMENYHKYLEQKDIKFIDNLLETSRHCTFLV